MTARQAAVLLVLALVPGAALAEETMGLKLGEEQFDVVGQLFTQSDLTLLHVGLGDPNFAASWGLSVGYLHRPEDGSVIVGAWVQVETPLLSIGEVPKPYQSLQVKGFAGADALFDPEAKRGQFWPEAGLRIAPQKTMAILAMVVYPIGDESIPSVLDYNELTPMFGLELRF